MPIYSKMAELYAATYSKKDKGRIWLLGKGNVNEPIAERADYVNALCFFNDVLYDISGKKVFETHKNPKGLDTRKFKPITIRPGRIYNLFIFKGNLCDIGTYGGAYDSFKDFEEKNKMIKCYGRTHYSCVYDNKFVVARGRSVIVPAENSKLQFLSIEEITALGVDNGNLIAGTINGKILNVLEKKLISSTETGRIRALESQNGELFYGSCGIFDLEDRLRYDFGPEEIITAMCSH